MKYRTNIKGKVYSADTMPELSAIYCRLREESGEGASTFRSVNIHEGKEIVAHISYNGRVWSGPRLQDGTLLFEACAGADR